MPLPSPAAGETLPASTLVALATRGSYTPALTATTTNPSLGTLGSISGDYYVTGQLVWVHISILFGSGPSAGSGTYRFSVPSAYPVDSILMSTREPLDGNARLRDDSVPTEDDWRWYTVGGGDGTTVEIRDPNAPGTALANNAPWTWAASDRIVGSFFYVTSG